MAKESLERGRRQLVRVAVRTTVLLVLLTFLYFALPLRVSESDPWFGTRLGSSLLAFAVLVVVLVTYWRRGERVLPKVLVRIERLVAVLYVLALGFALVYVLLAWYAPGQITGIRDRVDSLYFSVTTLGTVGFGDVHATGDAGRIVVTVQMVFDLVFVGSAIRVLSAVQLPPGVGALSRSGSRPPGPGEPAEAGSVEGGIETSGRAGARRDGDG